VEACQAPSTSKPRDEQCSFVVPPASATIEEISKPALASRFSQRRHVGIGELFDGRGQRT
jgi:hypothetical protein